MAIHNLPSRHQGRKKEQPKTPISRPSNPIQQARLVRAVSSSLSFTADGVIRRCSDAVRITSGDQVDQSRRPKFPDPYHSIHGFVTTILITATVISLFLLDKRHVCIRRDSCLLSRPSRESQYHAIPAHCDARSTNTVAGYERIAACFFD